MQFPDIMQKKLCHLFYYNSSIGQDKIGLYWYKVYNYYYHIISRKLGKFYYEINT